MLILNMYAPGLGISIMPENFHKTYISFLPLGNINAASSRLRCIGLAQELKLLGYETQLGISQEQIPDVLFVQKIVNAEVLSITKRVKAAGGIIIYDIDDYGSGLSWLNIDPEINEDFINHCDVICVDTDVRHDIFLKDPLYARIPYRWIIPDPIDYVSQTANITPTETSKIGLIGCWFGNSPNIVPAMPYLEFARQCSEVTSIKIISNPELKASCAEVFPYFQFEAWDLNTFPQILRASDFCLLIHDTNIEGIQKSNNKMLAALAQGVVPFVSRTPAYETTAKSMGLEGLLIDKPEDLLDKLNSSTINILKTKIHAELCQNELSKLLPAKVALQFSNQLQYLLPLFRKKPLLGVPQKKILIVCSHFWPSHGGVETRVGQMSIELANAGYAITVMTLEFPGRNSNNYHGVFIDSVHYSEFSAKIRAAVASTFFDACILIQDPLGEIIWSVEDLSPPPNTRLIIQPIINHDGYSRWKDNKDFSERLTKILNTASATLVMTKSGPDTGFMQSSGIKHVYMPNACKYSSPAGDFRTQYGISQDRFLILHVANLYQVKNHTGLIDALPDMPDSWQLVMIGNIPGESVEYTSAVMQKLLSRPEIMFIPGLPPEWVAAAMEAANVVVLASHGEGSPITLLETMSHRKPWLATPQCGAANDYLGGIICELPDFKANLQILSEHKDISAELAQISHEYWRQCHSWEEIKQGWINLIEAGRLLRQFEPSQDLITAMNRIKQLLATVHQERFQQLHSVTNTNALVETGLIQQTTADIMALIQTVENLVLAQQPELAITLYQAWLRHMQSPLHYAIAFNLGALLENSGNFIEAEQAYRLSVELKPDFEQARLRLEVQLKRNQDPT